MHSLIQLNAQEIPMIQSLAREIWEEHYSKILSPQQIEYMLNLFYSKEKISSEIEKGFLWEVLYIAEIPMGFLVCELRTKDLFLSKIYLKEEIRGKGFGKYLLQKALKIAYDNQKESISLNVNKQNKNSILFYERNGFEKVDEGVFDIGNGYVMDDFIYELKV